MTISDDRPHDGRSPVPYGLPGTERLAACSPYGRRYELFVARPTGEPPSPSGYPVLYLLDGNAVFGTAAEIVGLRSRRPEASGIVPSVVVAIGYPTEAPLDLDRRAYDFTPPADVTQLPPRPDGSAWSAIGGADEFLDFIIGTVRPAIRRMFPIDMRRQALFGHSFGGLFALHTLFTHTQAFSHYIAASPSIWWYRSALRNDEAEFCKRVQATAIDVRLLVTVGDREQELTSAEASAPGSGMRAEWKARNRMVENAGELAVRMKQLRSCGLQADFVAFEGEDHTSVIPASIARAVSFALGVRP